jgi:cell division protein YceG involved in septum cleavage
MKFLFKFVLPLLLLVLIVAAYFVFQQFNAFKEATLGHDVKSFEIVKGSNIS